MQYVCRERTIAIETSLWRFSDTASSFGSQFWRCADDNGEIVELLMHTAMVHGDEGANGFGFEAMNRVQGARPCARRREARTCRLLASGSEEASAWRRTRRGVEDGGERWLLLGLKHGKNKSIPIRNYQFVLKPKSESSRFNRWIN